MRVGSGRSGWYSSTSTCAKQAAIHSLASKVGMSREILRNLDPSGRARSGQRPGATTSEFTRLKELEPGLEREVRELRTADDILRKASA